jgi:hypothetical protein
MQALYIFNWRMIRLSKKCGPWEVDNFMAGTTMSVYNIFAVVGVVFVVVLVLCCDHLLQSGAMTSGGVVFSFESWTNYKIGGSQICLSTCLRGFE